MDLQRLQRVTVDALEDIKAHDIKVFDTLGQSSEFDRVIVATGNSNRQTRALAWNLVQKVKESGGRVVSVEGTDTGEWVLVDLGDVVVHIMQPAIRQYYGLEELWGSKPVRFRTPASNRTRPAAAADPQARAPAARVGVARAKRAEKTGRAGSVRAAKSTGKVVKKSGRRIATKRAQTATTKTAARDTTGRAAKLALKPAAQKTAQGRTRKVATKKVATKSRPASRSAPAATARSAQARAAKSRPAKKT